MGRKGGMGGGRSGGGGLFGSRKPAPARAPSRSSSSRAAPPPARKPQAPPPAQPQQPQGGGGGMLSGLAGTVMQGMAFGTGSAVAHRAVDAIAGPRTMQVEHVGQDGQSAAPATNEYAPNASEAGPCGDEFGQFNQCIKDNQGNISTCKFYYDILQQCQQNDQANSQWK